MAKKTSSKSSPKREASSSTVTKGRIVERIAALMHDQPGVTVQRNQYLSPVGRKGKRREIDVLITAVVAGYPVRMAIECKNEARAIDSSSIEVFAGKLQDVGIPPQHGIFVSASGYTADAVERAKTVGMRTLTLRGLRDEDLLGSISDAFQSVIYLLPQVLKVTVTNTVSPTEGVGQIGSFGFYNENGMLAAVLPDLVWRAWHACQLPAALGEHEVALPLPSNLHQEVNGRAVETFALATKIQIIGLAVTLQGKAQNYALVDAVDEAVERVLTDVSFEASSTKLPLTAFASEEQLQAFLSRPGTVRVTTRLGLPRIIYGNLYWPPSERVVRILKEHEQELMAGNPVFTFQELEGTDLQTVWEPIAESHPAHQWMKHEAS
jgi:hypothetical protein